MTDRYLDDYRVGDEMRSQGRTITDADIRTWAALMSDWTELHVNSETMAATPFGVPIAHGYIAFNLAVGLMYPTHGDWYWPPGATRHEGWADVRFTEPVKSGDTLWVQRTVVDVNQDQTSSGVVAYGVKVVNQEGSQVMTGEERIRIARR